MDRVDVLNVVCDYFGITPYELFQNTRSREVVYQRFFYFLFCRKYTKQSTFKIGDLAVKYGRNKPLDHATVLHGVNTMYDLIRYDKPLDSCYREINELMLDSLWKYSNVKLIPQKVNLLSLCET